MDVFGLIQLLSGLIVIILTVIIWRIKRRYDYWKKLGIPYEKPLFLIGNLGFMMRRSVTEFLCDLRKKHPSDYVGIFLAMQPALVVQAPELAKRILIKESEHFRDRYIFSGYAEDPLGKLNLFAVKEPIWSEVRHNLSPMFTPSRLKVLMEFMNLNARELVLKVQRDFVDNRQPVHLKELFCMYASDTVVYSVFGAQVSALSGQESPLWYMSKHMVKWDFWRGFEFLCIFLVPDLAKLLRLKFFSAPATTFLRKLFWTVVNERKSNGNRNTNEKDLINQLIKIKDNFSIPMDPELADNIIVAQAAVIILGSVDTSSSVLSYCLHELAHHPAVQEKLYNQINDALKQKEKDILEYDDLLELKYLSACIYETMRKYTPVPYLDRICNQTYKLNDNVTIEKGTPVLVNLGAIHTDERYYPEPQRWLPERIDAVSDNDNINFTYLPFGEGPRRCIGKRYAMMQMRAVLAQLVHKYKVEPAPAPYEQPINPYSFVQLPKSGGCVKFVPREESN